MGAIVANGPRLGSKGRHFISSGRGSKRRRQGHGRKRCWQRLWVAAEMVAAADEAVGGGEGAPRRSVEWRAEDGLRRDEDEGLWIQDWREGRRF